MAERQSIFGRTQTTTSPVDPLQRRQTRTAYIEDVTSDTDAARKARQRLPQSVTIEGTVVPLFSVTTTRTKETGAFAHALYALQQSGGVTQGFNRFRVTGGYEDVEWVRTPGEEGKDPGKAFDKYGRPDGLINYRFEADGGKVPHPYLLSVPVWHISVETFLSFNPLQDLPAGGSVNSASVEWDGIVFPPWTVRFNAPAVEWATGDKSDLRRVNYTFTARKDRHVREILTSAAATQHVLTGKAVSFGKDAFPIARTGAR